MSYSYSQMNQNNQQLYRYPLPPYPIPTTVLCSCAAFCDCYDESPETLSIYFDPIELKYREKSIQHAKRCFDMPSILNMISKLDHITAWMVLNTLIRQKCAEPRKIYYKVAPITEIFSDDILQYIVSFNEQYEVHCINKAFKEFAFKNETIRMRHWIQTKTGDETIITKIYQSKMQYAALHQHSNKIRKKINIVTKLKKDLENRESTLEYRIRDISKELNTFFQSQPSIIKDQDINRLFPVGSCIKYNQEVNDVWLVDNTYYESDDEEDKHPKLPVSDYKGPFEKLSEVLEKCKNGDTIYTKGYFEFLDDSIQRNVNVIGIDKCTFVRRLSFSDSATFYSALCIANGCSVHFQNIQFRCDSIPRESEAGFFRVGENAKLFLSNCQMEFSKLSIRCNEEKGSVYAQKCLFIGTNNKTEATAIVATAYSKDVFITNCTFVHCGNPDKANNGKFPCVKIPDIYELSDWGSEPPITINFEAAGNSFENNYGCTIGVHCTCYKGCCFKDERLKIHDNTLKGFNGLHISDKAKDANCYWICDVDCDGEYVQFNKCAECGDKWRGECADDGLFYCWDCWTDEEDECDNEENKPQETKKKEHDILD